jgi:hypothetical protein
MYYTPVKVYRREQKEHFKTKQEAKICEESWQDGSSKEHLLSKCEALSSNASSNKTKEV